jgi:hypothetical protein
MIAHTDVDWRRDLASGDEERVVRALHGACPCSGSSTRYEQYMDLLHQFKKDPRPKVRAVALHLEEDAFDRLRREDERTNGFVRNRQGGNGRRGEPRKARVSEGW